jgi:peroxiredoxin
MSIKIGDAMPAGTLTQMTDDGPVAVTTDKLFAGKRVALFAVPGAYTPTCSKEHLPGFVAKADALAAKGIDTVACMAVNDAFVMGAWGADQNVGDKVMMLADGNGDYTKALGLELDLSGHGLGTRSARFSMIVDDGAVTVLNIDEGGGLDISDAETLVNQA